MRVFVAGGAGYIGSACTEYLLDRGYEVTVFDDLITGHIEAVDPRAKFIKANLADRENLKKVVKEGNYDAIMHFAAFSLVGESMKNPSKYFNNNLANAINLADAAVEGGVKTFVFSSTAATFGEPKEIPIKEDAPQLPINPYGESKLCFEKVLNWYSKIYGLKYAALRYFNAAGATEKYGEDHNPETHLIPILLQVAQGKREKAMLFGDDYDTPDGTCIRDYIHILDLAHGFDNRTNRLRRALKRSIGNRLPVDAETFGKPDQVRRRIEPRRISATAQSVLKKGADGALAVAPRDMNEAETALRIAETQLFCLRRQQ